MTTNCYRSDVYRFNIDSTNNTYEFEISNVISWELMNIKMTKEELKGLADFIYQKIEPEKKWVYAKPIIGIDDKGMPIAIDSWNNKDK